MISEGIFINGEKVTFNPENILNGDVSAYTEAIGEATQDWLDEHLEPGGSVPIDDTLSIAGSAADAKAAGDAISELNTHLNAEVDEIKSGFNELGNPPKILDSEEEADLYICDADGNVIGEFIDGHIKTKNFDSSDINIDYVEAVRMRTSNAEDGDLDVTDPSGNVILRFTNGELKTKKLDLTNPYFLPEYYSAYLDEKIARIKELMAESGGDAFFFITDQHFVTGNAHQSYKLIHHIAKRCKINKVFCGGDMWNGVNETYANEFRRAILDANGGRCYMVAGNHEYFASTTEGELQYGLTAFTDDEIGNPSRHYFYVDNPKNKVRYIVLNAYTEGDTVSTREDGYEAEQMTWLREVALNVETGWHIIIIGHEFYRVTNLYDSTLIMTAPIQAVLAEIDAMTTNGTIVCLIQGHTHVDAIRSTEGGIPILITCCDKWEKAGGENGEPWLANRTVGTTREQCFDVCILDTVGKKLTAVRIGGFATDDATDDAELYEAGERVITFGGN